MKERFELEIEGKLENLSEISDFIANSVRALGLYDRKVFDIQMAVDEACANIISHGYHEKRGTIALSCRKKGKNIVVTITDEGTPFDPTSVKTPDLDVIMEEQEMAGLGVYFIKTLVDAVNYDYRAGKNVLTLIVAHGQARQFNVALLEKVLIPAIIGFFAVLIALTLSDVTPLISAPLDLEGAREILEGVGVEGLSAIFAIVISLTLMAVQFASQQYTHRIMDLHIKSLTFWSVIAIYLGSLLYNVFALVRLEEPVESMYVELSVLLTALSFVILVPYFFITMLRLKPESVIGHLLSKVDDEYLHSIQRYFREGELRIPGDVDKVLPVEEIIEKSISSGDRGTARFGIDEIYRCYMAQLSKESEAYVSPLFLKHLLGIGREAIIEADDDSMVQVLEIFGEVGTHTIAQRMNYTTRMVLENINLIGFKILKEYDVATQQMIDSLEDILREYIATNSEMEDQLARIFTLYHDAIAELFTLNKYRMVKYMITSSSKLLDMMIKNKHSEAIEKTADLMERIAVFAMKHHEKDILKESVLFLRNMGIAAARNKLDLAVPEGARTVQDRIIGHLLEIKAEILRSKFMSKEFEPLIADIEAVEKDIERYKRTIQQPSD
jgi:serine/threonine-protein kinase RsbW